MYSCHTGGQLWNGCTKYIDPDVTESTGTVLNTKKLILESKTILTLYNVTNSLPILYYD